MLAVVSVETASPAMLEELDPNGKAELLLSGQRAAALGLGNRRDAADAVGPVLVGRPDWLGHAEAFALADPGRDFDREPLGPLDPQPLANSQDPGAALDLARRAGLLPALWVVDRASATIAIDPDQLRNPPSVREIARARLPLRDLPSTQIVAFRGLDDGQEHVALVVGAFGGAPPLVRLHSECLTGDVFGSLKCDCGPQLKEALKLIGSEGGGVLLYLRQEGRGIGLANKLRAYALQDRGFDTVDSNQRLGFFDDERDYAHAGAILRALKIDRVRLLTNNPAKVAGLTHEGIEVTERVAHHMPANPHNADYLATKKARSGHLD